MYDRALLSKGPVLFAHSVAGFANLQSTMVANPHIDSVTSAWVFRNTAADEHIPVVNTRPKVSAVLPCLNEAGTIGLCIEKIFRALSEAGMEGEIVVADNGSTDGSVEIALELGARVVHQSVKGYGAALRKGIADARGDVIVMADADDSYDWLSIADFVRKVEEGYDLVMGNRFKGGIAPGAMPALHRYFGNPVLSGIARIAFGVKIGDFHCGMRAFRRDAAQRMLLSTDGMEFATEMIANAAHQGLHITEIPTRLYPDKRNRPPHLRSFRDGWRHLRFILTYAPDYLYIGPGILLLAAGLALQGLLVAGPLQLGRLYMGIHFLALGSLLALVGFNILNLGILAKALMSSRYPELRSKTLDFIRKRFRLENGLIVGALLALSGLGADALILIEWLQRRNQGMTDTIHLAFVASTLAALGLNIIFSSFLLNLVGASARQCEPHSVLRAAAPQTEPR